MYDDEPPLKRSDSHRQVSSNACLHFPTQNLIVSDEISTTQTKSRYEFHKLQLSQTLKTIQ